jgi:FkbH-like protein
MAKKLKDIKCVVWDLDDTLWDGILLESKDVILKPGIKDIITIIDSRGILQSIASKNNYDDAKKKLEEFGLFDYFIYPELNWDAKSNSLRRIQENLNIGIDTFMFIDDQPYERDEVSYVHPDITCVDAAEYKKLPDHPRLNPRFLSEDSKRRRLMYIEDMQRKKDEHEYVGPKKEFLLSLNMIFSISEAIEEDLQRAEELTERTNQLNTTGTTYSFEELKKYMHSDGHKLFICELKDKYGSYGKIGLALIEIKEEYWNLKLLLMSCRVMTRGVGTVLLYFIMSEAKKAGKKLMADFKKTDRNRMMFITFKFANFKIVENKGSEVMILENDLSFIQKIPPYINVVYDSFRK